MELTSPVPPCALRDHPASSKGLRSRDIQISVKDRSELAAVPMQRISSFAWHAILNSSTRRQEISSLKKQAVFGGLQVLET